MYDTLIFFPIFVDKKPKTTLSMKKVLFLISAVILAACTNSKTNTNNANIDNTTHAVVAASVPHVVDWKKPQYSIDDHGDTITRWIYDERGRLLQILTNYDDEGKPGCITDYSYIGNKAHIVFSCEPGYEEDITYADESCTKILENSGQVYEYDEEGRLSKIIIGNNEITYDYSYLNEGKILHVQIDGNYLNQFEERDELRRLISESHIEGAMDAYSTTYTYEGNVCHARVENIIYKKGDFGAVPDLEDSYTDEYEYEIYY